MKIKEELKKKLGIDGQGRIDKRNITVKEFEELYKVSLSRRQQNEYGTEDCTITLTLIDEEGEDFSLTLEIENEIITHSYY